MQLLNDAILKYGSASEVARKLGVTPSFIYAVRDGRRALPEYQAGQLAELLGRDPINEIWQNLESRARNEQERKKWRKWKSGMKAAAIAISAIIVLPHINHEFTGTEASTMAIIGNVMLGYQHANQKQPAS